MYYDNRYRTFVRETDELRYDKFRDGLWYSFTGREVYKNNTWWGEYHNYEKNVYGLFN